MMIGYLKAKYTNIDYDDVIQETLVALARVLPNYRYNPEETGHFRNYLAAVLRNKACDAIRKAQKICALKEAVATDPVFNESSGCSIDNFQRSIFTIALRQILEDDSILERNRRIFVEVAINGRSAIEVANMFGVERNNVDQIKSRIFGILQKRVSEMSKLANDD